MKNFTKSLSILLIAFSMVIYSCKKDETEPADQNNNNTCNYTTNVLVVGSSQKNISVSSCIAGTSDYTSEHYTDSTHNEGLTMIFDGSTIPAAGTYTTVSTIPVPAGKVYVEYFESINAYQPTSGTITVSENGNSRVFTFCNLSFSNGSVTKTISARATCN